MRKKFLQKIYKDKRSNIPIGQFQTLCRGILDNLIELSIWDKDIYHIYLSMESKNEVYTNDIISFMLNKSKRVIVPKMLNKNLIHFEIDQNTKFIKNKLGIKEPISKVSFDTSLIEIIIVPLLVFDKNGHRVGYGGGYYDRFMSNIKDDVIKVGLSLFDPVDKISDINDNDIPLNFVVTPSRTYNFN
tara:strand:+ start:34 stop:594 length:561 start_codon:yes stop_codon:yes gene_type:complete